MKKFLSLIAILSLIFTPMTPAYAAALTLSADATWASTGNADSNPTTTVTDASANDTVVIDTAGVTMTVTNDQTANDGSGLDDFQIGAVTDTGGSGNIAYVSGSNLSDLTSNLDSANIGGNFSLVNRDVDDVSLDIIVNNGLTVGGNVTITSQETDSGDDCALDVNVTYQVTGSTTITTGTVAGSNASLNLSGADIDFTGGVILDDVTGTTTATLTLDGAAPQDVTGTIDGAAAGEGTLRVNTGANAVTFNSAVGTTSLEAINVMSTGTTTFGDTVAATTTTFSGAGGTLSLGGSLTGDLALTAANTVAIADNANITGAITTDADNQGTLNFAGTSTVSGAVGTSAILDLATVSAGAAGETVTFSGDVWANAFNVTSTGTVALNGSLTGATDFNDDGVINLAAGEDITGAITNTTTREGTLNLLGAHTITGAIGSTGDGLKQINLTGSGATITGTGNVKTLGIDLGTNTLNLTGGTFTLPAAGTIATTISGTTIGNVQTDTGATITGGTLNLAITGTVTPGTYTVVNDTATTSGVAPDAVTLVTTGSSFYTTSLVPTATNDDALQVVIARVAGGFENAAVANADSNTASTAAALDEVAAAGATGDMATIINTLDLSSPEVVAGAIEQMDPDVSRGSIEGTQNSMNQYLTSIGNHLSGGRLAERAQSRNNERHETGVATGDGLEGWSIWAQGFGNHINQDDRKGVNGYDADTFGFTVGGDTELSETFLVGAAFGIAWSDIDSKGAGNTETDITSYQPSVYASYSDENLYVDSLFAFAYNDHDQDRTISFPGVSRTANADFGGQQWSWKIETGYTFGEDGLLVTPIASLQYTYLRQNSYTESGAGALNLSVDSEGYHFLEQGLGLEIGYPLAIKGLELSPSVYAMWKYDYIGDRAQTTSSFAGGGTSFSTRGAKPAQHSFVMGAELLLFEKNGWSVVANYDFEGKDEFSSHSYAGTVKYAF